MPQKGVFMVTTFITAAIIAGVVVFGIMATVMSWWYTGEFSFSFSPASYFSAIKSHWKLLLILWIVAIVLMLVLHVKGAW